MKKIFFIMLLTVAAFSGTTIQAQVKNIALVHGAFADGSGWQKVSTILKAHGYKVSTIGNPNTGLEDHVAAIKRVSDRQDGPVILVGPSCGGAIITVVGNSSNVAGLVYVAAFTSYTGEALGELFGTFPVDPLPGILSPVDGFAWYDLEKYHSGFSLSIYF